MPSAPNDSTVRLEIAGIAFNPRIWYLMGAVQPSAVKFPGTIVHVYPEHERTLDALIRLTGNGIRYHESQLDVRESEMQGFSGSYAQRQTRPVTGNLECMRWQQFSAVIRA